MIRKALAILAVLILALGMMACGGKGGKTGGGDTGVSSGGAGGPVVSADGVKFTFKPKNPASKVFLAGEMNGWKADDPKYALNDLDGDGVWELTIKLDPGTYKYKFVADGSWFQDEANPKNAPDGFGGKNSVVEVK